jgi:hypothetical protein
MQSKKMVWAFLLPCQWSGKEVCLLLIYLHKRDHNIVRKQTHLHPFAQIFSI